MEKENELTYPKIVKASNGSLEYHFKGVGESSNVVTKIKNLVQADAFSDGYALVRLKNKKGELVYKFLDLNGNLSKDDYYFASDYSCGHALCQKVKNGSVQFRDLDGHLSAHGYKMEGTTSFKRQTNSAMLDKTAVDAGNKYGFAEIPFGKKVAYMDMMGNIVDPSDMTKHELEQFFKLGTQFYNYFYGKMPISKFDERDLQDRQVRAFLGKLIDYKHNISMIECLNRNDKRFLDVLKSKTADYKFINRIKDLEV